MTTENEDPIFLNDIWSLYFHNPYDLDWTNGSYILLNTISTVDEFWQNHNSMKDNIQKGMFFLMREHVFPCWDDPENIDGGVISIKILKENLQEFWEYLCINMLGEILTKEPHREKWKLINGISTSPKKHFSIVKIWLKTDELSDSDKFNLLGNYYGDIIYKSNMENISNENVRLTNKITPES